MSRVAVIATFYRRPWAIEPIVDALRAQTRKATELWAMCDDEETAAGLYESSSLGPWVHELEAEPGVNPLAAEINYALDRVEAEYVTYLTDDSVPYPDKYRRMAKALDDNPDWGAVYCSQDFGSVGSPEEWLEAWDLGLGGNIRQASEPEPSPFCRVDHTQVMHRATLARWPESYDDRKLSDAHFFRDLVADLGPLMPVPEVLDWTRQLPDGLSKR